MKLLIAITLTQALLFSSGFEGTGFGQSHKEAKQEALVDLSNSIRSEVKSVFKSYQHSTSTRANASKTTNISSNLPIVGAEYVVFDIPGGYNALCSLNEKKAVALYSHKLQSISKNINELDAKYNKSKSSTQKYNLLNQLLVQLDSFERHESVAIALGMTELPKIELSIVEIKSKLNEIQKEADSLPLVATIIAKQIKENNIYIYPPKAQNSHEITPFAKAVVAQMKTKLSISTLAQDATYILKGNYIIGKNSIQLNYTLLNKANETVKAISIALSDTAYKNYEVKPTSKTLDSLLHDGLVESNDFKSSITTDRGDEDLLYTSGEDMKILIRLNNPGYYYIVGHVKRKNETFSYLLDLNEADGNDKFIGYVSSDKANKPILLGEFTVEAPYGVESIQLIASNKKIKKLPEYYDDDANEYYILGDEPEKVVIATRGIKRKSRNKAKVSESVLMFTTMK